MRARTLCTALLLVALNVAAQADEPAGDAQDWFRHGDKGFELGDPDGRWFANVDLRAQLRYTGTDIDERSLDGGSEEHEDEADVNRLRLKFGGNVLQPWIKYSSEQEVCDPQRLLDLRQSLLAVASDADVVPLFGQYVGHLNDGRFAVFHQQNGLAVP